MKKKKKVLIIFLIIDLVLIALLGYFYINDLYIFEAKEIEYSLSPEKIDNSENTPVITKKIIKYELPEEMDLDYENFVNTISADSGDVTIESDYLHSDILINNYQDQVVIKIDKISLNKNSDYEFNIDMDSSEDSNIRLVIYDKDYDKVFLDEIYQCNTGNKTFKFSTDSFISYSTSILLYLDNIKSYTLNGYSFYNEERINHIRIDQVGYEPTMKKIACFTEFEGSYFEVISMESSEVVYKGPIVNQIYDEKADEVVGYGDFSIVDNPGNYYIRSQNGNYSYEFSIQEGIYDNLIVDVLKMISSQRCGYDLPIEQYGAFGHPACHNNTIEVIELGFDFEASGGWHDAGDYGRYTSTIDKTAMELMMSYYLHPDLYSDNMNILESGNNISDILDEVKVATDYLMKIQISNGSILEKIITESFAAWVEPNDDNNQLYAFPPTTMSTAYSAGVLMMGYQVFKDIDLEYAEICLSSAKKAYNYVISNDIVGIREIDKFNNNGQYRDYEDLSERYFMNIMFGIFLEDESYFEIAENLLNENEIEILGMDYYNPSAYASYLFVKEYEGVKYSHFKDEITKKIITKANSICENSYTNGYLNSNTAYFWGANYQVANTGALLGFAYDITGDEVYLNNARNQLHYILGTNTLSRSYVTGYGSIYPQYIHHRISSIEGVTIKGAMVGGPNDYREVNEGLVIDLIKTAPAKNYIDSQASFSTNEIAIYYNSSLELLLSVIN
jgi:endoglucanase